MENLSALLSPGMNPIVSGPLLSILRRPIKTALSSWETQDRRER